MGLGVMNMNSGNVFGGVTSNIANNVEYKNPSQMQNVPQTSNVEASPNEAQVSSEKEVVENNNANTWKCACGNENDGKFCSECGAKKPEENICPNCKNKVEDDDKF